jgi:hypothetical protein
MSVLSTLESLMELSEQNAVPYLRDAGRASPAGEILVQRLSAPDSANVVLKIFDTAAGDKIGTDLRTDGQKQLGKPDTRASQGACFVLKQPRLRAAQRELDQARPRQERACLELLANLLPAGSVPESLWFDEAHDVLGLSCPPPEAVVWLKQLRSGVVSMDAATHAGMLLAMIHSSTRKDPAVKERFGDPRLLVQQSVEPMIRAASTRHPALARNLQDAVFRLRSPLCLIHGDFRLENVLLVPAPVEAEPPAKTGAAAANRGPKLAHVMLVDFETAFFGHNAYDVATLVADLLLVGFLAAGRWRALMMMVDNFWQTYRHTADPELVRAAEVAGGRLLGAVLLGRVDGDAPVKELLERRELPGRVRGLAQTLLKKGAITLDEAIDEAPMHFDPPG